jgi:hypothetical protein
MKEHLQEARWFIKSLHSRNDTLLRVGRSIIRRQTEFLEHAIVRRATLIPFSFSNPAILLSLSGFTGLSLLTNSLINARIAVAEHSPPSAVETWLEKKYLNSKLMLRGVR